MAAPAIGLRSRWMSASPKVDWSHPMSQGLYVVRTPAGVDGTAGALTTRQLAPASGVLGYGVAGPTTSTADAVVGFQSGAWSYVVCATVGASTNQAFVTMAEDPASGTGDRSLGITTAGKFQSHIFDGVSKTATSATSAAVGSTYVLGASTSTSQLEVWVNGAREATTAVSNAGFAGYTSPEVVFGRSASTPNISVNTQLQGVVYFTAVWRRQLTSDEMVSIAASPFDMFRF